jgi:hypothetical protein
MVVVVVKSYFPFLFARVFWKLDTAPPKRARLT